ncbi:MAG: LON peptidase substrate-binding domain-containing protein, partial [Clostridia bacterium]|nr:LON peptidase substrate-binding domain-containing protein [Clostridia bacterium]
MSKYIEKVENTVLPVIALRGLVVFPNMQTSFEINNKKSVKAVLSAPIFNNTVFLCALEEWESSDNFKLCKTGVTAKVKQALKLPDGNYRVLVEGKHRAEYTELYNDEYLKANLLVKSVVITDNGGVKGDALRLEAISTFENHIKMLPKMSPEILVSVQAIKDP